MARDHTESSFMVSKQQSLNIGSVTSKKPTALIANDLRP